MPDPEVPYGGDTSLENPVIAKQYRAIADALYAANQSQSASPMAKLMATAFQQNFPPNVPPVQAKGEQGHGAYSYFMAGDKRFKVPNTDIPKFVNESLAQGFEPEKLAIYKTRDGKNLWVKESKEKKFQEQWESWGYPVGEYKQDEKTGKFEWVSPTKREVINKTPHLMTPEYDNVYKKFKSPDELGIYKVSDMDTFVSHRDQAARDKAAKELGLKLAADMEKNKLSTNMAVNFAKAVPSSIADAYHRVTAGAQNLVGGRAGTMARMAEYYEADPVRMLPVIGGVISTAKEIVNGKPKIQPRADGLERNTLSTALRGAQDYYGQTEAQEMAKLDPMITQHESGIVRGAAAAPAILPALVDMAITGGLFKGAAGVEKLNEAIQKSKFVATKLPTIKKMLNLENLGAAGIEGHQAGESAAGQVAQRAREIAKMTPEEKMEKYGNHPLMGESAKELQKNGIEVPTYKQITDRWTEKILGSAAEDEKAAYIKNALYTAGVAAAIPSDLGEVTLKAMQKPAAASIRLGRKEAANAIITPLVSEMVQEGLQSGYESSSMQNLMPETATDPDATIKAMIEGVTGAAILGGMGSAMNVANLQGQKKREVGIQATKKAAEQMKDSEDLQKATDLIQPMPNVYRWHYLVPMRRAGALRRPSPR
jgi:hypothetical protein